MPWNPTPDSSDQMVRRHYYAGYSDGYHGYRYGSGEEDPSSDYRRGYDAGKLGAGQDNGALTTSMLSRRAERGDRLLGA